MILVTGGSGFIGSHLLDRLSALGLPARALLRRKVTIPPGIDAIYGDLDTGHGIEEAVRGATTVIHLAGVTKALRRHHYYAGNAGNTGRLASAAAGRGLRFVHVSSLAAIGPSRDGRPLSEDAEPHPLSAYGKSKLEAERAVRRLIPDAVIVRPPVVYGPRDTDVFQLLKAISKGMMFEIAGGERWFSSIYVEDLVDALLAAAQSPGAAGGDFFVAHPKPATWSEFAAGAARIMSRRPRVVRVPVGAAYTLAALAELWSHATGKPGILSRDKVTEARRDHWICDTRRAAAELGFQARTPLDTGLAGTLAWYKEAGWLKY
jgi:nucleoside-diphosphate-sugar epimerase